MSSSSGWIHVYIINMCNPKLAMMISAVTAFFIFLFAQQAHGVTQYEKCADSLSNHEVNELSDGTYNITARIESSKAVYCSFDYINNYAWTLFESDSQTQMQTALQNIAFDEDVSYNDNDVSNYRNNLYRLSRDWIFTLYYIINLSIYIPHVILIQNFQKIGYYLI